MQDDPLYSRYTVTHKDGRPISPEKRYLVLELSPTPDEREIAAITAYIAACESTGYPEFAVALREALETPAQ